MALGDKVQGLLKSQRDILKEYEKLFQEINLDDPINENIVIKKEMADIKKNLTEAESRIERLRQENLTLRASLKEQMINERAAILNGSKQKMEIYFSNEEKKGINRLQALENSARIKINKLSNMASKEFREKNEEICRAINHVKLEIDEKIREQREGLKAAKEKGIDEMKASYDLLLDEEISEETLAKKQKHNDIEVKIGLNWINKAGIILLLLGVATAMRYTYSLWFNDYMKGISGFLLGGGLLAVGEWFNKKDKNLFALGLCGGGIGVLYLTVFSSYFFLNILSLPVSIIVSVLITMGSIVLSQRYASMTIAGISLFGGYLPFFSFALIEGISGSQVYIAMGYLLILNLLVLAISLERRWIYINYLSFLLNMPCLIYLSNSASNNYIGIAYGILTFMMYLGITLTYPIRKNVKLRRLDLVLLGLNTIINCLLVYGLFESAGLHDYRGFLALAYAISYFALSSLTSKRTSQESHVQALFSITALTFCILMIPFQFGIKWAAMGWLIEAVLMLAFAKKRNAEKLELGGWVILGICTLGFFLYDFTLGWGVSYFALKYSFLTIGLIYVFTLYAPDYMQNQLIKYTKKGKVFSGFKYFTILNSWVYLLRMFHRLYDQYLAGKIPYPYTSFYELMITAGITILFAYGILRIKAIRDKVVVGISTALLIFSNVLCIALSAFRVGGYYDTSLRWMAITTLVIYHVLVFISVKDLTIQLIKRRSLSVEYYPLAMAIYLLGVTTLFLTQQFNLANISLIISIIYIAMSFLCIAFGFRKNYLLVRRFGLGLSIFSTGKLFIFDLYYLSGGGKILAYFCFGIILIGISFIYQRLRTNMEEAK